MNQYAIKSIIEAIYQYNAAANPRKIKSSLIKYLSSLPANPHPAPSSNTVSFSNESLPILLCINHDSNKDAGQTICPVKS